MVNSKHETLTRFLFQGQHFRRYENKLEINVTNNLITTVAYSYRGRKKNEKAELFSLIFISCTNTEACELIPLKIFVIMILLRPNSKTDSGI